MPFDLNGKLGKDDLPRLVAAFHPMHERIYTIKDEADIVEFTTWKVRAIGDTGGDMRRGAPITKQEGKPQPKSHRKIYFGRDGHRDMPVYDGAVLGARATLKGPALIEQPTTSILILEGQNATIDDYGNMIVETRAR